MTEPEVPTPVLAPHDLLDTDANLDFSTGVLCGSNEHPVETASIQTPTAPEAR